MVWRYMMLSSRPMKKLQFCEPGVSRGNPCLPNLRDLALYMGDSFVATVYADASSIRGRNTSLRDRFIQGKWFRLDRQGSV